MKTLAKFSMWTTLIVSYVVVIGAIADDQFNDMRYSDQALCWAGFEESHCSTWTTKNGTVWFNMRSEKGHEAFIDHLTKVIEALATRSSYTEVIVPETCEILLNPEEFARIPQGCAVSGDVYVAYGQESSFRWSTDFERLTGQVIVVERHDVWVMTQALQGAYVHGPEMKIDHLRMAMQSPNGGCGLPEGCHEVLVTYSHR